MKHRVDPTVDCVFKAVFGAEENKGLLLNLVNAVLAANNRAPMVAVKLINPFNLNDYIGVGNRTCKVMAEAVDCEGLAHRVELNLPHAPISAEELFLSATKMLGMNKKIDDAPVISIWMLKHSLFPRSEERHFCFQPVDPNTGVALAAGFAIYVVDFMKNLWKGNGTLELQRWQYYLKHGENLDEQNLPVLLNTPELIQAVNTLAGFSDSDIHYQLYRNRVKYLKDMADLEGHLTQQFIARQVAEQALRDTRNRMADTCREVLHALGESGLKQEAIQRIKTMLAA